MRIHHLAAVLLLLAAAALGGSQPRHAASPPADSLVAVVRAVRASVACVVVPRADRAPVVGAALCVGRDGTLLVTAGHVVKGQQAVPVELPGGGEDTADVLGVDPTRDLAVLRLRAAHLRPVILDPAASAPEGTRVFTVGHPYGYRGTVTCGVVSAHGRQIAMPSGQELTGLLQTDAAVNPGNSGGPLVTEAGQVLGLVVALREGARGIAFVVPTREVVRAVDRFSPARSSTRRTGQRCPKSAPARTQPG